MKIIAVIPCFNVGSSIIKLINKTLPHVHKIIIIDDCCPKKTGDIVNKFFKKKNKVIVLLNKRNLGVGGAVKKGYLYSLKIGCNYIVKLDGDGQMDPKHIPKFKQLAKIKKADYIKGNRFFKSKEIFKMSAIRFLGNIGISYFGKLSTGLWHIFDFSNGYTFIKSDVLKKINFKNVKNNFFFETDILFQLGINNAKVIDINIPARYTKIQSNLKVLKVSHYFFIYNLINFFKRFIR